MFSSPLNLILRMTFKSDQFTEIQQDTLIRRASPVTRARAPTPHRCHHEGRETFYSVERPRVSVAMPKCHRNLRDGYRG